MIKRVFSLEDFKNLKVGDKVYFKKEKQGYIIKARNERYLIVVKVVFDKAKYSILDIEEGICSTNDLVFNSYDYRKQEDIEECLKDLEKGICRLSKRNEAEILKTTYKVNH
jgi:hypothetical protein